MYKQSRFLTIIFFSSFLQLFYTSSSSAMMATMLEADRPFISALKTYKNHRIRMRNNIKALPVRRHSTNFFSQAKEVIDAIERSDKEKIEIFLSTQSLAEAMKVLDKNTESYSKEVTALKAIKKDFNLNAVRESLKKRSNANNSEQESTIGNFNHENLDADCKVLSDRHKKLQENVNVFINNISYFIKNPILKEKYNQLEELISQAQRIKDNLIILNPFFVENEKRISYLNRENNQSSQYFFSEEIKKITEEIKKITEEYNRKEKILNFIIDNSKNEDQNRRLKDVVNVIESNKSILQKLESKNTENGVEAKNLEKWFVNCREHTKELMECLKRNFENIIEINNGTIEKKNVEILAIIQDLENENKNLKLFNKNSIKDIGDFLSNHSTLNSLFYDMVEMKNLQSNLSESNLTESIEKSIENIKKDNENILIKNQENSDELKKLKEKFEEIKNIIEEITLFIKKSEDSITKHISKIIKDELDEIKLKVKDKNLDIQGYDSSLATLRNKAREILSTYPHATEEDFYNIAGIKTVRILSIDGGGVKGIIPALILEKIEEMTGKPIASQFDVMAGTSVGGLLTLALNVPNHQLGVNEGLKHKASDLVLRAKKDAQSIFPKRFFSFGNPIIINYITSKLWNIFKFQSKYLEGKKGAYSTKGLDEVCEYYLGQELLKNSFSTVLIPTTRIVKGKGKLEVFNSRDKNNSESMKDLALATSAAPLYFARKEIQNASLEKKTPKEQAQTYTDGGLVLNNPAMDAYHRVRDGLFLQENKRLRYLIISLGTGQQNSSNENDAARIAMETIMESASNMVDHNLKSEFSDKSLGTYIRINLPIDKVALNDASTITLNGLEEKTKDYIKSTEGKRKIDEIVSLLKQKRTYTTGYKSIIEPEESTMVKSLIEGEMLLSIENKNKFLKE